MTASQHQALVSLLEGEDAATRDLVKAQLVENGREKLSEYRRLLLTLAGAARDHLREVIGEIEASATLGDISRRLATLNTFAQLEELSWELARAEDPSFESGPFTRQLDRWATEAGRLLAPATTPLEKVHCLARYLGWEQGLAGNSTDYYHPRNACLPSTIQSRSGLPITLALIYILVGRRLDLPVAGVGTPGHFLARLDDVIFDPYYHGRIVSEGEWELTTSELSASDRALVLRPSTPRQMMHRLLINQRNCYVKRLDHHGRLKVDSYLAVLQR
jgi:regulator of sirC expression with transglutaminase-like and TPR domain